MTRMIVTVTPPTPNGDLHLGHIAGPFLSADVFARVQRQRGHQVLLLSYSDDYQSYLFRKSVERATTPDALARANARKICETLAMANIRLDHFLEAWGNSFFVAAVREFYEAAVRRGVVETRVAPVPYCPSCDRLGYEAFARGKCNYCGAHSDASQCEACARQPDVSNMEDLHCVHCKCPLEWRMIEREFLRLDTYRDFLRSRYRPQAMRAPLRRFIDLMLEEDALVWAITRPNECGVRIDEHEHRVLHTWFCGIAGYHAALAEYADRIGEPALVDQYWNSAETQVVHFLGFDCSYSHALAYRALLSNCANAPGNVVLHTNAFLKLNGEDFSTSRGHAIWTRDVLADTSADCLRLYLAGVAPETEAANFSTTHFDGWRRNEFELKLNRLVASAQGEGVAAAASPLEANDRQFLHGIRADWWAATSVEQFSISALATVLARVRQYLFARQGAGQPIAPILAVYGALGQSIHPVLSATIARGTCVRGEPIGDWLRGATDHLDLAGTTGTAPRPAPAVAV